MIAAVSVLSAVAVTPSLASAATPFNIGAGVNPRIVVTANGTGHVVWSIPERILESSAVGYCRIPAGASACDHTQVLLFPSNGGLAKSGGDVTVEAVSNSAVRITSACYTCAVGDAQEGILRWDSNDSGSTFLPYESVGGTPTNAGMGPDGITVGANVYVTPADGDQIIARPGTAATAEVDAAAGTNFIQTPSIVQVPGQQRLLYASSDLFNIRTAIFNGPDFAATTLMNPANWTTDKMLPTPESGVRDTRLSSGPSGVWLTYAQKVPVNDHVRVRKFDAAKSVFGAPRSIEASAETDAVVDDVSSGEDAAGHVNVVWRTDLESNVLRYTRSDASGGTFAPPVTLATGESFKNPEVATGADGSGWVVWEGNDDPPIRALHITPAVLGGTIGAATPGASAKTKTTTVKVSGATISFGLPAGCVKRSGTFKATLTWKRQKKKGNLFVKITRTDFYIGSKRSKIDKKAPFTQTLRVPSTAKLGSTLTLRARAFIKVKKGKAPKKSIKATIKVCA